jgi:hypothetical protein
VLQYRDLPKKEDAWEMPGPIKTSCRMADTAGIPAFQRSEVAPHPDLRDRLQA